MILASKKPAGEAETLRQEAVAYFREALAGFGQLPPNALATALKCWKAKLSPGTARQMIETEIRNLSGLGQGLLGRAMTYVPNPDVGPDRPDDGESAEALARMILQFADRGK